MLGAGVIEAVVQLPARLRRDTSIPLVLWCLRPVGIRATDDKVLLVDASQLGTAGRSTVSLEEDEIDDLAKLLRHWSEGGAPQVRNTRIQVTPIRPSELHDGDLTPSRYRAFHKPDPVVLAAARDKALAELREAEEHARRVTADVLSSLERK
jgi:type I restriction-modification system DNA methylase subunit